MASRLAFFEDRVDALFELLDRVRAVFEAARVPYRVVGGLAVYMHASHVDPEAGRLTRDIDIAIYRSDLDAIRQAAPQFGFELRHAASVDLLVDKLHAGRRSVHFIFVGEKVRPEYVEPVPGFEHDASVYRHALVAHIEDLLRMKLTSFRDKDRVHVRDLDELGLITPDMEATLSPLLQQRLAHIRATE